MLYKYKINKFIILYILFYYSFSHNLIIINKYEIRKINNIKNQYENGIIRENFFIIDSNNLRIIKSHMYGYFISKKGIITDNYYKNLGQYDDPEPQGTFVLIRKSKNEIILEQDFHGNMGIYISKSL